MSDLVRIIQGDEAVWFLRAAHFRGLWQELYRRCPWATVFQSPAYLGTWYDVTQFVFDPVLAVGSSSCGRLTGLLSLAVKRSSGALEAAGKPYAEYVVWLALPEASHTFILATLDSLRNVFPKDRLDFRYLPPNTPLDWLQRSRKWSRLSELKPTPRPLMAIGDGSTIRESLCKKSNRSRFKRLERLGKLEFQRVRTFAEIESDFDDIMNYCDVRQGAVNNRLPFRGDPCKKPLFSALFVFPELLHATVWRLNGKVISAHLGFRNGEQVSLGLIAHSPFLAEHSPGKLHVLLLGLLLAEERIHALDLTPEGAYKERFATHCDEVHRLTVFFSRTRLIRKRIAELALRVLKRILGAMSVSPQRVREILALRQHDLRMLKMSRGSVRAIMSIARRPRSSPRHLVFRFDTGPPSIPSPSSLPIRRDDLNDLLSYRPCRPGDLPLQGFLSQVVKRLERGDHVYTFVKEGSLVDYVWLREISATSDQPREAAGEQFPVGAFLFDEFRTHAADQDGQAMHATLVRMLQDVMVTRKDAQIYAIVVPDDTLVRERLEELGFRM
jgi:CelD/BcsL family acetyltransferase involved in cellulose biosynthesis